MDRQDGEFVGHTACPDCGSRDNLTLYIKKDNKGAEYIDGNCWTCDPSYKSPSYLASQGIDAESYKDYLVNTKRNNKQMTEEDLKFIHEELPTYEIRGNRERRIKKSTYEKYGVHCVVGEDDEPTAYYFPNRKSNEIVGCTVRELPKNFYSIGDAKVTNDLFGQHLFPKGGKFLVITTGREDCMAMYQTLANGDYETACVSVTNGDGGAVKQIKANYEWIVSFEKVILAFDGDDVGQEAVDKVSKLLKPGQAYAVKFSDYKDASDYVKNGKSGKLKDLFWKAEKLSPSGIVGSSQTLSFLKERASFKKIPLPEFAEDLQEMFNGGIALGEITTIAAASSVGKTTITNEFLYHFIFNSPYKFGIISLESDIGELTENLLSIHLNRKFANMDDERKLEFYNSEECENAHRELTTLPDGTDRYYILDHQGATVDKELEGKIEYLVKGLECKGVVLDPLTLALSGAGNDGMDLFMSNLLRFVKREKIAHINVVHVRKNSNGTKANSTGADIHEEDIKGSGSIFQVSMNNILLMRDKENEDPTIRNTTKVVVSKNRRCGRTGPAGYWYYDENTSRLTKSTNPHAEFSDDLREFEQLGAFNDTQSASKEDIESAFSEVDNIPETEDFDEELVFNKPQED